MNESSLEHSGNSRVLLIAVAVAIAGVAFGYYLGRSGAVPVSTQSENALLKEIFGDIPATVLLGKITQINPNGSSLTLLVENAQGIQIPKIYQTKQIALGPDSKIFSRTVKDKKTFEKEIAELRAKKKGPVPVPSAYQEQQIRATDLTIGTIVTVFTVPRDNQTVLDVKFIASSINVTH